MRRKIALRIRTEMFDSEIDAAILAIATEMMNYMEGPKYLIPT